MNRFIRKKLTDALIKALDPKETKGYGLNYKTCRKLAEKLDCDPNSVARLIGLENFKPTQILKPETEDRIACFLQKKSFEELELELMIQIVMEAMQQSKAK